MDIACRWPGSLVTSCSYPLAPVGQVQIGAQPHVLQRGYHSLFGERKPGRGKYLGTFVLETASRVSFLSAPGMELRFSLRLYTDFEGK